MRRFVQIVVRSSGRNGIARSEEEYSLDIPVPLQLESRLSS